MSLERDVGFLSLALPLVDGIVSHGQGQYCQLCMDIFNAIIFHLKENTLIYWAGNARSETSVVFYGNTSIMMSKSVPNTGFVCLMNSWMFSSLVLSLLGIGDLCPALLYAALSLIEPVKNRYLNDYKNKYNFRI